VSGLDHPGYYATDENHITAIAFAQVFLKGLKRKELESQRFAAFMRLPDSLSFGDGQEQIILHRVESQRSEKCRNASIEHESRGG
jgi:hypothetical protein